MLILNIEYKERLYKAVTITRRVEGAGDSEVARYAFGDPTLDWRLMRYAITFLQREGTEVHRGVSCDRFIENVRGYQFDENDQLIRVGS